VPFKVWSIGEEVLAADFNSYVQSQVVSRFATAAARTAAITSPVLNQLTTLDNRPGITDFWNGSAWQAIGGAREASVTATPNVAMPLGGSGTTYPYTITLPIAGTVVIQGTAMVYREVPGTGNSSAFIRCAAGAGGPAVTSAVDSNFQVQPDLGWLTVPFSGIYAAAPAGPCNFALVGFSTSIHMRLFSYQIIARVQPT